MQGYLQTNVVVTFCQLAELVGVFEINLPNEEASQTSTTEKAVVLACTHLGIAVVIIRVQHKCVGYALVRCNGTLFHGKSFGLGL